MITAVLRAGRPPVLAAAFGLIAIVATADWAVGNRASLGLLYIVPMVVAATALPPVPVVALAVLCSVLRSWFDIPAPHLEVFLRFLFAFLSYAGLGLFVIALIRNRAATLDHLARIGVEQSLRREAEEQLKILVESSPAAILTVDESGIVLAANRAAGDLLMLPEGEALKGRAIGGYLPILSDALQFDPGAEGLRTAAQCQSFRANGEIFLASMWFSSWRAPEGKRLAAIVVDSSEEMRDREEESLRQMMQSNQIAAAAIAHEVRNLCGAISVVTSNLTHDSSGHSSADLQALGSLVKGLEKIAEVDLQGRSGEVLEEVSLRSVLDDLRIVIEPQWRELGGVVRWTLPEAMPTVLAEGHGLLQACLNLAQNSLRAVQGRPRRELTIALAPETGKALLRFDDTGPGVGAPERLFAPLQPGSDGTGLGLYVSRAVVRSYGGDLRHESGGQGSSFVIELLTVNRSHEL